MIARCLFSLSPEILILVFFSNDKRLNVAFSRAKRKLWIVGQKNYTDTIYHWEESKKIYMLKEIADSWVNEYFSLDSGRLCRKNAKIYVELPKI